MAQISDVQSAWSRGDKLEALRIAAQLRFQDEAIYRAWQAIRTPEFYRQIGKDPDDLVELGYRAIASKYGGEL